jgi:hypothetical protein
VILLIQLSPAAAIPALILVVNATHLLYMQWRVQQPPREIPRDPELFANVQLPERNFFREFGPGFAVSVTLQTGVCAVLLQHREQQQVLQPHHGYQRTVAEVVDRARLKDARAFGDLAKVLR